METNADSTHSFRGSRGRIINQPYEKHQSEEASNKLSNQLSHPPRGNDRGSFRGNNRGSFRGNDRGSFKGNNGDHPLTHDRPYKPVRGPVRKQQMEAPIHVEFNEVVSEANQGTIDESYPPPDPSKYKNKDKYDPEKRKLLKEQIKVRKHYVDTNKEKRKEIRDDKKAIKNVDRKEKIEKIRELTTAYKEKMKKEGIQPSLFVLERMEMFEQNKKEQINKGPEPIEEKQVVMIGNKAIRNQKFIKNARCPMSGKFVKEIWRRKFTKIGREKWDLVWQYYRDRNRESILSKFKKLEALEIEVTYFGEANPVRFIVPKIDIEEEQPDTRASKKTKLLKLVKILENLEVKFAGAGGYISPPDKIKLENRIEFMKTKIQKFESQIEKLNVMYGAQNEYDQDVIKGLLGGVVLIDPKNIVYIHPKTKEPLTKEQFEDLYKLSVVVNDLKNDNNDNDDDYDSISEND